MKALTDTNKWGRKVWIAARFVLFGVGGFWLLMLFSLDFIERFLTHHPSILGPAIPVPVFAALILAGALMMLFAVGEWGRWAYLLVFLSIPILIALLMLLPTFTGNSKWLPIAVVTLGLFSSYAGVRAYYRWRARTAALDDDNAHHLL